MVHQLFQVKVKNSNETYAIDLTGAQYGYYKPVTPLAEYFNRVRYVMLNDDIKLGETKAMLLGRCSLLNLSGQICRLNREGHKVLKNHTIVWEEDNKITVEDLLAEPLRVFEEKAKDLSAYILFTLESFEQVMKGYHDEAMADIASGKRKLIKVKADPY